MVARQAQLQLAARGRVQVDLDRLDGERLRLEGPGAVRGRPAARTRAIAPRAGDRALILAALAATRGNRAGAARRLGVSRSTLYRRLERLGIETR